MIEIIEGWFAYWVCFFLLTIGLYGIICKRNLLKKVIGLTYFQAAIILFFIIVAFKDQGTVPVQLHSDTPPPAGYINPLPHALMLTAIVVGVATVGVALSLLLKVYARFQTVDESNLQEKFRS